MSLYKTLKITKHISLSIYMYNVVGRLRGPIIINDSIPTDNRIHLGASNK